MPNVRGRECMHLIVNRRACGVVDRAIPRAGAQSHAALEGVVGPQEAQSGASSK